MKVQSIGDIITNSSSEVFCYVTSEDKDFIKNLYSDIDGLFGYNQESEITPVVYLSDKNSENFPYSSFDDDDYDYDDNSDRWEKKAKDKKKKDDITVVIELPYSKYKFKTFYHKGLISYIEDKYKDKKYELVLYDGY